MLTVENLESGYGRARVLFGVSLEIADRQMLCVLGRNGVGKTTMLNTLLGIIPPLIGRWPTIARRRLVLPTPLRPSTQVTLPGSAVRLTRFKACAAP